MINHGIWQNQLPSNRFRLIYSGFDEIHIEFTATIRTSALSQFTLKGYRYEQIQEILKLKKKGLTDQHIAEHLNSQNIKTPTENLSSGLIKDVDRVA